MEKEFIPPKSEGDQAEFNNAFAFLERINKIEYYIEDSLMNWKLKECYSVLESYENELFFAFKGDDEEDVNEIKDKIIAILNQYPNIGTTMRGEGRIRYIEGQEKTGELRLLLIQLNKLLRGIKHKSGMGMPTKGAGKLF